MINCSMNLFSMNNHLKFPDAETKASTHGQDPMPCLKNFPSLINITNFSLASNLLISIYASLFLILIENNRLASSYCSQQNFSRITYPLLYSLPHFLFTVISVLNPSRKSSLVKTTNALPAAKIFGHYSSAHSIPPSSNF